MKKLFLAFVLAFLFVGAASATDVPHTLIGSVHWTNPEQNGSVGTSEYNTHFTTQYNQIFSSETKCEAAKTNLNLLYPAVYPLNSAAKFGSWVKIIAVDCVPL